MRKDLITTEADLQGKPQIDMVEARKKLRKLAEAYRTGGRKAMEEMYDKLNLPEPSEPKK